MDELKKILTASVPFLGSIIGTASPIAGVLFNSIAHLFGLSPNTSPEALASTISADPDHDVKLRTLEVQQAEALIEAQTNIRLASYQREEEITKATGKRDWVMEFIAVVMVLGFFGMCFIISFMPLVKTDTNLLYLVIGQFSTGFITVLAYYFGATNMKAVMPTAGGRNVVLPPPAQTR